MLPPFDYFEHRRACTFKQAQRAERFASLPSAYTGLLTPSQRTILNAPIAELVSQVQSGSLQPTEILHTYGKTTAYTQSRTNCVTELLLPDAEKWLQGDNAKDPSKVNLKGPLAGIPVSLKDTVHVGGFDTSVGFSLHTNKPLAEDGVVVKLLKRAGAIPHAKTALPITLLSFESTNSLWGIAKNPHNPRYSPGGSTGGEGAILALNGSRIGIGSDVAGSVRAPAAWSGIFSLRCSTGRWPKVGVNTSMPGQEGIPSVFSPMARTLDDLTYFTKSFIGMKPWEVDYTVHPIPWRQEVFDETLQKKKLRIGVIRSDGVVRPSPAIARGVDVTVEALRAAGHEIVDIGEGKDLCWPAEATPLDGLRIASTLLCADGGQMYKSFFRTGEWMDRGAKVMYDWAGLPKFFRWLHWAWVRYVKQDHVWASLLSGFGRLSAYQNWQWVAKRETFRAQWFAWLEGQELDLLLCPANATPALPHGCMGDAVSSCGYTFLFNLLDYSAGVVPVTKVDKVKDALPSGWKAHNEVEVGAYKHYDSVAMEGLPIAVQVVGAVPYRLSEEKTLAGMKRVVDALEAKGIVYEHLDVEKLMEQAEKGDHRSRRNVEVS